jgi:hypothetical protein
MNDQQTKIAIVAIAGFTLLFASIPLMPLTDHTPTGGEIAGCVSVSMVILLIGLGICGNSWRRMQRAKQAAINPNHDLVQRLALQVRQTQAQQPNAWNEALDRLVAEGQNLDDAYTTLFKAVEALPSR